VEPRRSPSAGDGSERGQSGENPDVERTSHDPAAGRLGRASGFRLCREFEQQLPDHIVAVHEANVRLRTGRLLIPDLVVTTDVSEPLIFAADDVLLAGEVVSSWGQARERILKPAMYAASGIAWYLLVERDPELELVLHRRRRDGYVVHARARHGERLAIPYLSVDLEVDALLRRR